MRPYAGVDYNLTLCPLQSRLQHIYHGQTYARIDLNPMPESTLSPSQGLYFGLWWKRPKLNKNLKKRFQLSSSCKNILIEGSGEEDSPYDEEIARDLVHTGSGEVGILLQDCDRQVFITVQHATYWIPDNYS